MLLMPSANARREVCAACEAIQQITLGRWAHQRLKIMLTVNIGKPLTRFAQGLHRDRLAIEEGAGFTIAGYQAPHQQFIARLDTLLIQSFNECRVSTGNVEGCADLRAFAAGAHDFSACTSADHEL